MKDLVPLLQRAAHPDRLRILNLLARCNLCRHDLEVILGLDQVAVLAHLSRLRGVKLVRSRREGVRTRYYLARSYVFSYPFTSFLHRLLPFMPEFERDLRKLEELWDQGMLKYKPRLDPFALEAVAPAGGEARGEPGPLAGSAPVAPLSPRPDGGRP